MGDASSFWRSSELHDATLLLSSDRVLLEQSRSALEKSLSISAENPKKRKASTAVKNPASSSKRGSSSSSSDPPRAAPATQETEGVLKIPVHRIVLSMGSDYFKTAIATLIGNSTAAADGAPQCHPIIVVHESDVDAAQGVLQFLYTKTVDSSFTTALQLTRLLLVSTHHENCPSLSNSDKTHPLKPVSSCWTLSSVFSHHKGGHLNGDELMEMYVMHVKYLTIIP